MAKTLLTSIQPTCIRLTKYLLRFVTQQHSADQLTLLLVGQHDLTYREVAYPMVMVI